MRSLSGHRRTPWVVSRGVYCVTCVDVHAHRSCSAAAADDCSSPVSISSSCCRCGSTPPIPTWWPAGHLTTKSGCGMSAQGSASTIMTLVRRSVLSMRHPGGVGPNLSESCCTPFAQHADAVRCCCRAAHRLPGIQRKWGRAGGRFGSQAAHVGVHKACTVNKPARFACRAFSGTQNPQVGPLCSRFLRPELAVHVNGNFQRCATSAMAACCLLWCMHAALSALPQQCVCAIELPAQASARYAASHTAAFHTPASAVCWQVPACRPLLPVRRPPGADSRSQRTQRPSPAALHL